MFWSRNKGEADRHHDTARPEKQTPDQAEPSRPSMPPRPGRMPAGHVYGYMGDVPLHRPLNFSQEQVREIFRGVPPETLAKLPDERLTQIARAAYVMAESQIHMKTPLASFGVDALTRRFAARMLEQALAMRPPEQK